MTETQRRELNPNCKALQYSDQMNCHVCRLVWDVNDPDPPKCLPAPTEAPQPQNNPLRRRYWTDMKNRVPRR